MLMQMLSAGGLSVWTDHERAPNDDNPRGYLELERIKSLAEDPDREWIRTARGKVIKVISHLLRHLPDDNYYRVVFSQRDLREIVASQNKMLVHRSEPNPVSDEKAIELYRKHLVNVRLLASSRSNFEMVEVGYRDTLEDPRECAQRINGFLGGRLDIDAMVGVVDRSLYRNREKPLERLT